MSLLSRVKQALGVPEPRQLTHPYFGDLRFIKIQDPGTSYWEGSISAELSPEPISLAIEADTDGPTPEHEAFFAWVVSEFDQLLLQCRAVMISDYEAWCDKPFPDDFRAEFTWVALMLPADGDKANHWEMGFDCRSDITHFFTVHFEDGAAAFLAIDG